MKHAFIASCAFLCCLQTVSAQNTAYEMVNFVANDAKYKPTLALDKDFINAWGISIRPQGAGGHFWVTAKDKSYEYVGDVTASKDKKLQKLFQDDLREIMLPVGGKDNFATGTVFSGHANAFTITQKLPDKKTNITQPSRFLFASDGGIISAWTEQKNTDGMMLRPDHAISVIDESAYGSQFFGLTVSHDSSKLYVADFGAKPALKIYDSHFKPLQNMRFQMPFDLNKNGVVDAGEYAPFNVQALQTPEGKNHIFVTYAKTSLCPAEAIADKQCTKGDIWAGEEDISKPGYGKLAEFTESGKLVRIWDDKGNLSAPWGVAFAPKDFGDFSGQLLVSNFGDGTIAGFDPKTGSYTNSLQDSKGKKIIIDKIWGILFGNGESLGDSNALYYAAGINDEQDGIFGTLRLKK